MPFFAMIGHDGPRGAELRKVHRQAHLDRLEPLSSDGRVLHAGPLLDDDGNPVGSLVVFEAPDLAAARSQAQGDPYVVEGVFERLEVFETRVVFPR